jgi:nucleotide-binding universal stress UspA family protein
MARTDIVVGIDGSDPSRAALRWAAAEAKRRGARLHVVLAYHWRWPGMHPDSQGELASTTRQQAGLVVDEAVKEARELTPDIEVRGDAVLGLPAQALIDLSADAALVVVGSRGHGGFASLLLGSVSDQVAAHATAPVAVVRGRTDTGVGPLAVGVDGSPGSENALAIAFEEAARRGCGVAAIAAYSAPASAPASNLAPIVYDRDKLRYEMTETVSRSLATWHDKYPNVPVETDVAFGQPAQVLINASRQSRLVVVGVRGHGGFDRLPLGSVGRQLLHHADCPVLIARPQQ